MATNVLRIVLEHKGARIFLHGDMSVNFDEAMAAGFSVSLFTTSNEVFNLNTTNYHFRNVDGTLVKQISFGGMPGQSVELMFDPEILVWYITSNNFVNNKPALSSLEKVSAITNANTNLVIEQTGTGQRVALTDIGVRTQDLQHVIELSPQDVITVLQIDGVERQTTLARLATEVHAEMRRQSLL